MDAKFLKILSIPYHEETVEPHAFGKWRHILNFMYDLFEQVELKAALHLIYKPVNVSIEKRVFQVEDTFLSN